MSYGCHFACRPAMLLSRVRVDVGTCRFYRHAQGLCSFFLLYSRLSCCSSLACMTSSSSSCLHHAACAPFITKIYRKYRQKSECTRANVHHNFASRYLLQGSAVRFCANYIVPHFGVHLRGVREPHDRGNMLAGILFRAMQDVMRTRLIRALAVCASVTHALCIPCLNTLR